MITRAQMPRQLRNKGGITNVVPRTNYLFGGIKDRIRKLIPNELADVAVKAAPFVAPFSPGTAALMRGIGRFDQRGSISDAVKQGLGTFAFGELAGKIPGTQDYFGKGMEGARTLVGDIRTKAGNILDGRTPKTDPKVTDPTNMIPQVPKKGIKGAIETVLQELPKGVRGQLIAGTATAGASLLASYFQGEFREQEPGETIDEYLAARRQRVGQQMRTYMDSYFKTDPEYSALDDAGRDAFVARYNLQSGGRVGYGLGNLVTKSTPNTTASAGGVTMANTLAENIRRNLANQAAVAQQFRQARANIPGYVEPQKIAAPKAVQQSAQVLEQARAKIQRSPEQNYQSYLDLGGKEKLGPFDPVNTTYTSPIRESKTTPTPKKVIPVEPGPAGIDNLLPDLYEKVMRPPPRKIIPEEGTVGPITKLPVEPDPDTPIDELVMPIMPTLPVEPRTDQDLIEGFEKFKQENPEVMQGAGIAKIIEGILPDGTPITFSGGVESNAFNKYLESLGLSRADIFKPKAMPIKSIGLEKLAKGGMPVGIMRTNKAGVMERDYRDKGGFVPVGIKEKADDVPAMLSKNEFVFTADAVRGAGGGSIEKGAQRMYNTMKNLEKRVV